MLEPVCRVPLVHQPQQRIKFRIRYPAVPFPARRRQKIVTEFRALPANLRWRDNQTRPGALCRQLHLAGPFQPVHSHKRLRNRFAAGQQAVRTKYQNILVAQVLR